jgi:serine/threonine protein kinase
MREMSDPVIFGKYLLTQRIAVGGMAEIYKAKVLGLGGFEKDLVVKQILPQYARFREFVDLFIEEAKIAVSLNHGNIVPVYELGQIDGIYFISMDQVDGKNLGELLDSGLDSGKPLTVPHALFIACEILSGLDYAHRKTDERGAPLHIVHRDVSPQNILISFDGEVKIVDFGIARAATKVHSTQAGIIKGKFGYMSPEQALGKDVDARSDVFAAGILLYEMLTLERLFFSETDVVTLDRVKRADVPTPSKTNPALPPQLDAIVFKALARDPAARFQSASEMRLALSRFLYQLPVEASSKTLSAYLKTLFGDELTKRQSQPALVVPAQVRQQQAVAEPRPRAPAAQPLDLLGLGSGPAATAAAPVSSLDQALSLSDSDQPIDDDFSYSSAGRKTKLIVILAVVLGLGTALFLLRHPLARLFGGFGASMDQGTSRLANKKLGILYITSRPTGASVYFANQKVGTTDLRIADIDPNNEYELVITMEGYPPFSRRILPSDWKQDQKMELRVFKDWTADSLK